MHLNDVVHSRPAYVEDLAPLEGQFAHVSAAPGEDISAAPTFMSDLPLEAIACILQHIPLQERLGSCSLVSTSWWAAAVTATSSITKPLTNSIWHPLAVMGWISTQQPVLTALHLSRGASCPKQSTVPDELPIPPAPPAALRSLKKLRLESLKLCIPLWLQAVTCLTRLELAGCYLGVSLDGCMACIAALPHLQELQFCVQDMGPCAIHPRNEDQSPAGSSSWGHLSALTHLHRNGNVITRSADTVFPQLASLTYLKELLLPTHVDTYWQHCYDLTNLEPLQQLHSITRLRLPLFFEEDIFGQYSEALTASDLERVNTDHPGSVVLSSVSVLAASLPDLKHLELVCDDVAEQGNINWSRVWRCMFVDLAHLERLELECDYVTGDIMSSLSHLTNLTALRLHQRASGTYSVSQRAPCIPPSAFAALTSRSNLRSSAGLQ